MTDIASWLAKKGLAKHVDAFRDNDIDFDVLASLGEDELRDLGLSLGDRKRLKLAIAELAQAPRDLPSILSAPTAPSPLTADAERRQLTIVFVDLVDSTTLSRTLDPEDLRDTMRAYHHNVAQAIREAQGFIAKFMGDGVLAYFGYPHASEDAAERAVRASLHAVAAVKALAPAKGHALVARAGVATGPVVVGDVLGDDIAREVNVVGETPNLAARLLALGPPGAVIVGGATRRLIGELFALEELAPQTVKGIAEPVLAFRVTGERQGLSRYEATRRGYRSTFVGRGQEVGLLLGRWEQAKAGDGQLVLLSGEAGIGKSRIAETLWQSVASVNYHRIRYQCTPQHSNSPLYPAITQLSAVVGLLPEDEPAVRISRIRSALAHIDEDRTSLVAGLLGVPLPSGSPLEKVAPARKRQLLLGAFADQLAALCHERPALWVIEDAHWIDPTTEELISAVAEKAGTQKLLIVVTHRPEYRPPWSSNPIATQLALNRLSRTHASALIQGLAGSKAVPAEVMNYVTSRTDGVPLFMEELFQALCDSGAVQEKDDSYELARSLDGIAIPATLQDSLMARLDRVAPAKTVAQIGAVIGREFGQALLESVAGMKQDALNEGLNQLLHAGLLFSRGTKPEVTYAFKHALVQDAAYGSMLRQRRQEVHDRIAQVLSEQSSDIHPALIAHHFEAAGQLAEAVEWLEQAADVAAQSAANHEAIRFTRHALKLLETETATEGVQRTRVGLLQKLAAALIQVEGYGSAEAFELGEAALRIAFDTKDFELYVRVCTTNGPTLFPRQEYGRLERQLAQVSAQELKTVSVTAQGRFWTVRGVVDFHRGRFAAARHDLGMAVAVANDIPDRDASFGGEDVRFVARSYLSRSEWIYGLLDTSRLTVRAALATARNVSDPFSVAWGLMNLGRSQIAAGQYDDAITALDESIAICQRYGYAGRLGHVIATRGVAKAYLGDTVRAVREIEEGFSLWRRSSGEFSIDLFVADAAHAFLLNKRHDLARPLINQVVKFYETGSERAAHAECQRIQGLFLALDGNHTAALEKLKEAIEIAEAQSANLFRLRACIDLARLHLEKNDVDAARNILAPAYRWFTEGFDWPDLIAAKALLDQLGQ